MASEGAAGKAIHTQCGQMQTRYEFMEECQLESETLTHGHDIYFASDCRAHVVWLIWVVCIVLLVLMLLQYVLLGPRTTDYTLMVGGVNEYGMNDSGESSDFISHIKLFSSWNDEVPNITFNNILD